MSRPDLMAESSPGVYLYWIPLGAGGSGFVRLNGRIYEVIVSQLERRASHDLYHTALVVNLAESRFVVETMWPQPDRDIAERGVVVEGPVFASWLSFTRVFRYEVRCWRDGILPDAGHAVGGPRLITDEVNVMRSVVEHVPMVPAHTWGRRLPGTDDMWNSNSCRFLASGQLRRGYESDQRPKRRSCPGMALWPGRRGCGCDHLSLTRFSLGRRFNPSVFCPRRGV